MRTRFCFKDIGSNTLYKRVVQIQMETFLGWSNMYLYPKSASSGYDGSLALYCIMRGPKKCFKPPTISQLNWPKLSCFTSLTGSIPATLKAKLTCYPCRELPLGHNTLKINSFFTFLAIKKTKTMNISTNFIQLLNLHAIKMNFI